MKVAQILKAKGADVIFVVPTATIEVVARRLRREGVGALVVSADGTTLDGIITERDVTHGIAIHGRDACSLSASSLMTAGVVSCSAEDSVAEVARVMTVRRLRHLLVIDGQRLGGIVSIGDVLKSRLDEMQLETRVLRDIAIARA